jgi:hypothetical protein
MYSVLNCHVQNTPSFTWDSYGSMWLPLIMQGFSKKLYDVIQNVTVWRVLRKRLRLTMDSLYAFKFKRFRNTRHTVTFLNHCKALFETSCICKQPLPIHSSQRRVLQCSRSYRQAAVTQLTHRSDSQAISYQPPPPLLTAISKNLFNGSYPSF